VFRVVQAVFFGLQNIGQIFNADPLEDGGGRLVGRFADHARKLVASLIVQGHLSGLDFNKRTQQDANLGHAGGIQHDIRIDAGHLRVLHVCDIYDDKRGFFTFNGLSVFPLEFLFESGFQSLAEIRIKALP
jgi:hypothetical protein